MFKSICARNIACDAVVGLVDGTYGGGMGATGIQGVTGISAPYTSISANYLAMGDGSGNYVNSVISQDSTNGNMIFVNPYQSTTIVVGAGDLTITIDKDLGFTVQGAVASIKVDQYGNINLDSSATIPTVISISNQSGPVTVTAPTVNMGMADGTCALTGAISTDTTSCVVDGSFSSDGATVTVHNGLIVSIA